MIGTNNTLEEKREKLFTLFQKYERKVYLFEKYRGPGFISKIKRALFAPQIYFPYLLVKVKMISSLKNSIIELKSMFGKKVRGLVSDREFIRMFPKLNDIQEIKTAEFLIKNLKSNDVFYDIGANYGFFSLLAAEFITNGEIHCFEPIPEVFECLKYNLLNSKTSAKLFINKLAVSNISGEIEFYFNRQASGISNLFQNTQIGVEDKIKVTSVKLNDYFKNHNKPTIIKVDVEGAESLVIEGGFEFFSNNNPIIAMEVSSGEKGKKFSMKAVNKLYELGYKSYQIKQGGAIKPVLIYIDRITGEFENFIFKK